MKIFNEYHKELEERAIKERQKRMYELKVRKATKKGYKQGMQKGIEQGKQKAILNAIIHLSSNMNIAYNQAMDILNIPQDEQEKYLKLLDV